MDVQDQTKTGHEGHGVHICHRCGWPFPNAHPSARHRRSHKKICGTIEGYTNLIDSGMVSDEEHHPDDDLEKTPSPMIEKKKSTGIGGRSSRSEEDLFSDAVTEFSDSGTSPGLEDRSGSNKSLDRDLFFSFKDAENGGTNEVLNNRIEISECETPHLEKLEETEVKFKEIQTSEIDECVIEEAKDEIEISSESAKSVIEGKVSVTNGLLGEDDTGEKEKLEKIADVESNREKFESNQEFVPEVKESEIDRSLVGISEEIKQEKFESGHGHVSKVVKESEIDQGEEIIKHEKSESNHEHVSAVVEESGMDQSAEIKHETLESDHEHVSEVVKESGMDQRAEIKHEKLESDHEHVSEVVKGSEIDQGEEIIKHEKFESNHEHALEVKKPETDQSAEIKQGKFESDHERAPEVVKEPEIDRSAEAIVEEIKQEKSESDHEPVSEVVKEPETDQSVEIKHAESELDHEHSPEVVKECAIVQGEEIEPEKFESEHEHVSDVFKEPETHQSAEIKHAESEFDHEHAPKVIKESEVDEGEEIKQERFESEHEHVSEVVKEPETDQSAGIKHAGSELDQELVKESGNDQGEEIKQEKLESDHEHAPEVVEKSKTDQVVPVLTEKDDDVGAPQLEKCSNEHTQEVLEEPISVSTEKVDLGAPESEKRSKEHTHEVIKGPDSVLTEKEYLDALNSEQCSKDQTPEDKNTPNLVSEPIIEQDNHKPMNNQDSGTALSVDSSSRNSVEGNWGSVSVLSTASMDAETLQTIDKLKVNPVKPVATGSQSGAPDVFEPPSFITLVEPKGDTDDQKPVEPLKPKAPQAGWFPTVTNVSNESEGRKRNEEVIAKVTNWTTGKHSLKNLLGEAKSPSSKPAAPVVQKDEAPVLNQDSSPPKLIDDGKKVRKKSWVPFGCCSSVNVVN